MLVRVERADHTEQLARIMTVNPSFTLRQSPGAFEVVRTYTVLGIGHILTGVDHLLFVLALIMIVPDRRRLIVTITAFTIAHSISLALATLQLVHFPGPPVEATIALSIVFVAAEILHRRQGHEGLAVRKPWLIAFSFGLLHGLGFAGALAEVGLPQNAIPLALLFFNVGVEIGQLLFITAVLGTAALARAPAAALNRAALDGRRPGLLHRRRGELLGDPARRGLLGLNPVSSGHGPRGCSRPQGLAALSPSARRSPGPGALQVVLELGIAQHDRRGRGPDEATGLDIARVMGAHDDARFTVQLGAGEQRRTLLRHELREHDGAGGTEGRVAARVGADVALACQVGGHGIVGRHIAPTLHLGARHVGSRPVPVALGRSRGHRHLERRARGKFEGRLAFAGGQLPRQRRVAGMPAGDEDVRHAPAVQGSVADSARQRAIGMRGVLPGNDRLKVAPVGVRSGGGRRLQQRHRVDLVGREINHVGGPAIGARNARTRVTRARRAMFRWVMIFALKCQIR